MDWLDAKLFTTLFVSGNHENFDLLAAFPKEEWHGGIIQRVRPSVIHLTRGQVYDIEGKKFFIMGGASSHDISGGSLEPDGPAFRRKLRQLDASGALYRVNRRSWWAAELPSEEEYQTARANLDKHGWAVDYIVTHCCPASVQDELSGGAFQADHLTDFLDEVARKCAFRYWFFGHYHDNEVVEKKYVLLYEQIIKLKLWAEESASGTDPRGDWQKVLCKIREASVKGKEDCPIWAQPSIIRLLHPCSGMRDGMHAQRECRLSSRKHYGQAGFRRSGDPGT